MSKLPDFSLIEFQRVLRGFKDNGYSFGKIISPTIEKQTVYLRHDVDFFTGGWWGFPILESEMGISATYYFLPIAYNFATKNVRRCIRKVYDMGHDIGLHFDLSHYSEDPKRARAYFDTEVKMLEDIIEGPVFTVVRHQPGIWKRQTFDISDYTDPFSKEWLDRVMYISDSCRAWRDNTLLRCFDKNPPFQVEFVTHPEHWLNEEITDRLDYLEYMRRASVDNFNRRFVKEQKLWEIHEGGIAHDKRESSNNNING